MTSALSLAGKEEEGLICAELQPDVLDSYSRFTLICMSTEPGSELMQHGLSGGTDYGPAPLEDVSRVGIVWLLSLCKAGA